MSKNLEVSILLDFYGELLTDKQREAIEYYYNDDLSLGEIADCLGISRQGVHDSIKRAENTLNEFEEKLGLAKTFDEMQQGLARIKKSAENICRINKEYICSNDIDTEAQAIINISNKLCE